MAGIWDSFDNFVSGPDGSYMTSKQAGDAARAAAQAKAAGASRGLTINSLYGAPDGYSDNNDPIMNERFAAPGAAGGKVSRGTYGVSPEVARRSIDQTMGQTSKGNDFYGSGNVNEVQSKLTPGQNTLLGMTPAQKRQASTMLERLKGIFASGIKPGQLPGQVEGGVPVLNAPGVDPWEGMRFPGQQRVVTPGMSLGNVGAADISPIRVVSAAEMLSRTTPESRKAVEAGKSSYSAGPGQMMPTKAPNGKPRNTYGDGGNDGKGGSIV